jgi:hypothetical protein
MIFLGICDHFIYLQALANASSLAPYSPLSPRVKTSGSPLESIYSCGIAAALTTNFLIHFYHDTFS